MNFFRDLLGSSKSQTAETSQPPSYPRTPAYPSSSPPKYPARNGANRGAADEDQWSVDVAEKPVSTACKTRPGATVGAVGSKTQQQRREEEAAERAREEERIRQEEEDAKYGYSRVQLAMYDLSGGLVQYVPAALLSGAKFDGIWHTGVRVFDKEYWFGGGIFENEVGDSPFGAPVRVERLGISDRTHEELLEFIKDEVLHSYNPSTYHFLNRNCNHFSSEIVQFLLAGRHAQGPLEEVLEQPKWVHNHSLAQLLIPAMNKWLGGFGADDSAGRKPQVKHMTRAEKEQEQRRVKAQWADWVQEKNREWQNQLEERRREDEADEFQNWMLDQHQRMESEEKEAKNRAEREVVEAKKRAERDAEKQRQARQLEELIKAQQQYDEEERYAQQQRKAQEEKYRGQKQVVAEEQSNRQQPVQQATQRQREVEQTLREILDATKQGADAAVLEWALAEAKEAGLQSSAPFLIRDAEYVLRERT